MTGGMAMILAVALVTYATRLAGLLLAKRLKGRKRSGNTDEAAEPRGRAWAAFDGLLGYVPIAAFAALIVPGLGLGTPEMLPRVLGAAVAAAVVLRIERLWFGLGAGLATYWAVSALSLAAQQSST